MREKLTCTFSVLVYLVGVFVLLMSFLGIYELRPPKFSTSAIQWSLMLSPGYISLYLYYISWHNRQNPLYRKTSFMLATAMLLILGVEISFWWGGLVYRPVVGFVIIVFLVFFVYSIKFLIQAVSGQSRL